MANAKLPDGGQFDPKLLGPCMIYCGYCGVYKNGKCAGCGPMSERRAKEGKVWCSMRACSTKHGVAACADCKEYPCRKFDLGDSEDDPLFSKKFTDYIRENSR